MTATGLGGSPKGWRPDLRLRRTEEETDGEQQEEKQCFASQQVGTTKWYLQV